MEQYRLCFLKKTLLFSAFKKALFMFNPKVQFNNPVIFVTYVCTIFTTLCTLFHLYFTHHFSSLDIQILIWMWITLFFSNLGKSLAQTREENYRALLKKPQDEKLIKKIVKGKEVLVSKEDLKVNDCIVCKKGEVIPFDGKIIEGMAFVDESAITGESAPVIRESGEDLNFVYAGTCVLSDEVIIQITHKLGDSLVDQMSCFLEEAKKKRTPSSIGLTILLSGITLLFLLMLVSLKIFADFSAKSANQDLHEMISLPVFSALFVCLIPTTAAALLDAAAISGLDQLFRNHVIAKNGQSLEIAGDINLLILDKTGTLTIGNRLATALFPASGVDEKELAIIAAMASFCDETPEGRSIALLAKHQFNIKIDPKELTYSTFIPFSAQTKLSGINIKNSEGILIDRLRKGSVPAIQEHIQKLGGIYPKALNTTIDLIAKNGGTPLLISKNEHILGIVQLKDTMKGGLKSQFEEIRKMGIQTIMVTGDNAIAAATIAAESGVDDFIAEATPEIKLELIKKEQKKGKHVAMIGDGSNDAPALAQADLGVTMNSGTKESIEAGNMIDLDNNPVKLLKIIEISKQMLATKGALLTFSIATTVIKLYALIPAIFFNIYALKGELFGPLNNLNILHLSSPKNAILSTLIFNALLTLLFIPLTIKGIKQKEALPEALLKKHLIFYGLGGLLSPYFGIKLIDFFISIF